MTPELTVLALAALLQAIQFTLMAIPTNIEVGVGKTMSARDNSRIGKPLIDQVSDKTGRLIRAMNNHFEGLILFGIAVVVIQMSGQNSAHTAIFGWAYLAARVLYVPAYVFGWVPWRSLIWAIGFTATLYLLLSALM